MSIIAPAMPTQVARAKAMLTFPAKAMAIRARPATMQPMRTQMVLGRCRPNLPMMPAPMAMPAPANAKMMPKLSSWKALAV
ncbi:hypothetical protein D3C72_2207930 [compost metagenome]